MNRKALNVVFIFSLLLAISSVSWFIFYVISNKDFIFMESIFQFVLAMVCLSFFIAMLFLRKFFVDKGHEMVKVKEIEKSVRDFYQYHQLLNPPDIDN